MKAEMKYHIGHLMKKAVLLCSLSLLAAGTVIGPAAADDWHRDRDWRRHEDHEHWRRERWEHRHYYVPPPVYVVPPPRAVYAPPPVYVMPQPAPQYSIVVPLVIR